MQLSSNAVSAARIRRLIEHASTGTRTRSPGTFSSGDSMLRRHGQGVLVRCRPQALDKGRAKRTGELVGAASRGEPCEPR